MKFYRLSTRIKEFKIKIHKKSMLNKKAKKQYQVKQISFLKKREMNRRKLGRNLRI